MDVSARIVFTLLFVAAGVVSSGKPIYGDLLIPIGGSVDLFGPQYDSSGVIDDSVVVRNSGLTNFLLFGRTLQSNVNISENGVLSSVPNTDFFPSPIHMVGGSRKIIAPLWDDVLLVDPTQLAMTNENKVLESVLPGVHYTVTWSNTRLFNETAVAGGFLFPETTRSAQATLFGVDHTIGEFDFRANDIAFSYRSFDTTTSDFVDPVREAALAPDQSYLNASIGLADTQSATNDHAGFEIGGELLDANGSDYIEGFEAAGTGPDTRLPWNNAEFVLFRPTVDNAGNFLSYDVSIQKISAVPEPSSFCLLLIASSIAFARRRT